MAGVSVTADGKGVMAMSSTGQFYAYGSARPQLNPIGFTGVMAAVAVTGDGRGSLGMSSIGQTYAYGTARSLGNGDPGLAGGAVAGYAREILNNRNIDKSGRAVNADLQAAANGRNGTSGAPLSGTLLRVVAQLGREHSVTVTALESGGSGHSLNSPHYAGAAVDLGRLDGHLLTGRDPRSMTVIDMVKDQLPRGSGFGQAYQVVKHRDGSTSRVSCGSGRAALPSGVTEFADTCNHLHIQVPRGTP
jgi:hypothetical protein